MSADPRLTDPPAPPRPHPSRALQGAGLYALALLIFAGQDGLAKELVQTHSPAVVAAVRFSTQLILLSALLPHSVRAAPAGGTPGLVALRSLCLASLTVVMMGAFARLPLAEATAISFLAPLLVTVLAVFLLGERPGTVRWLGTLGGFAGLLLVVRPGGQPDALGVGLALLAALLSAVYQLLSRRLQTTPPLHLLYSSALIGTLVGGLAAAVAYRGGPIPPGELALMAVLGVSSGTGHFLLTLAFRRTDASLLAPLGYLQLVFAAAVGWLVFRQFPDGPGLAGMALICASGLLAVAGGRRRASEPATG